jgi:oxalyl-CoA decarboxylase
VLKGAKRPLIILGKGAAYAQADEAIRTWWKERALFLPMSMAKAFCPTRIRNAPARHAPPC